MLRLRPKMASDSEKAMGLRWSPAMARGSGLAPVATKIGLERKMGLETVMTRNSEMGLVRSALRGREMLRLLPEMMRDSETGTGLR